jgi:hypothetical protein
MSKAYPSNLTDAQYEFISEMIPEPKKGGRKREVYMLSQGKRDFLCPGRRSAMARAAWGLSPKAFCVYLFSQLAQRRNLGL